MGKVIKKKLNGMSWWMKTSLVLLLTLVATGYFNPSDADAVTYFMKVSDADTTIGIDQPTNLPAGAPSATTTVPVKTLIGATEDGTGSRYYPAPTSATLRTIVKMYSPVYSANAVSFSAISASTAIRPTAAGDTVRLLLYDYDPAGAANNKLLIATSTTQTVGAAGTTVTKTWAAANFTFAANTQVAQGHRLLVEMEYMNTVASPRIYFGVTGALTSTNITFTETPVIPTDTTAPVAGAFSITPGDATYTSAAPLLTMGFTDPDSTISGCAYSINSGGAWTAATWTAGTGNCTATVSPAQTNGTTLNIQMRATSPGGTSIPGTTYTRTVDTTGPTDGILTVLGVNGTNTISWTGATATGSALRAANTYDVRYLAGATPPASCAAGASIFTGTGLSTSQTVTVGTTHSYRVCAYDILNQTSVGATATNTNASGPVSTLGTPPASCGGCHGNPPVDSANATTRAAGLFAGDHGKHTAAPLSMTCANCHTNPITNDHSDGSISIASPLRGVVGESSSQATHAVTNSPTFGTCTTYCHSQGTSKTSNVGDTHTASITAPNTVATWATTTLTCTSCHNSPPSYANGALMATVAKANSHAGTTHAAQTCNVCHNSVTYSGGVYTLTTGHANGLFTVAPTNITYTYAAAGGTCASTAVGCHAGSSIQWGASLACLDCHGSTALSAPNASALSGATITTRRGISTEFGLTSNHTRSRGAITSEDCGVCHMEGIAATGAKNETISPSTALKAYHGNGLVELRNADTGTTIVAQTWNGAANAQGAFVDKAATPPAVFVRFTRNLAARPEAETTNYVGTTNTIFEVNSAIQVKHCLTCHDAGGATNALARIPAAGTNAFKPFNATVAANPNTGVLDVASQFASSNRSYHPVLFKQNNGYAGSAKMVAPWNNVAKSGTTTVYGPLMTCWDCHAGDNATGTLAQTVTHGGALAGTDRVTMRGRNYATAVLASTGQAVYCLFCHSGYTTSGGQHTTGSALVSQGNGNMSGALRCTICHSSTHIDQANVVRPNGAGDAHGYDTRGTLAAPVAFTTAGTGYAFIRSTGFYGSTYYQRVRTVGGVAAGQQCTGFQAGGVCGGRSSMGAYGPGGVY